MRVRLHARWLASGPLTSPPASSLAAPGSSAQEDDLVRTRVEKYGSAIAPAIQSTGCPTPPVEVRSHLRAAPLTRSTGCPSEPAEKRPVTLDAIIEEYRKTVRSGTKRHVLLGRMVNAWIQKQPERPPKEQLPRAAAIIVIEERILAEGLDPGECDANRDLKCYHTTRLLGGDFESLTFSAIRHCHKFVERDAASEHWRVRPQYREQVKTLWARMLAEHLTAAVVKAEIDKIFPPKAAKNQPQWSRQASTVLRLLPILSPDERVAVRIELQRIQQEEKRKRAAIAAA